MTTIPLTRLDRRAGAALVERVTGGKTLPKEVTNEILARTDGVPLFIEELTKTVLESGLLQERNGRFARQRVRARGDSRSRPVPRRYPPSR
jgi:predicted ATPase